MREIGGLFVIQATAKPGGDIAQVERAVNEEVARFLREGPTAAELQRVKTGYRAGFIRGVERIGGFGGKSDVLAQGEVFAGRADFYTTRLKRIAAASAAQIRATGNRWLSDGDYTLEVLPSASTRRRGGCGPSKLPEPGDPAGRDFPAFERATLSNGLQIVLSPPVPRFLKFGSICCSMLATPPTSSAYRVAAPGDGDARRRHDDANLAADRRRACRARRQFHGRAPSSTCRGVTLYRSRTSSIPRSRSSPTWCCTPRFPAATSIASSASLAADPAGEGGSVGMALRVLPILLYGHGHAYGQSLDRLRHGGIGREDHARRSGEVPSGLVQG